MTSYTFHTVDVFTERRFGGNPLAVFPNAEGLSDGDMQSLATELNLSETTFVLPPAHAAHSARVRIFCRFHEMPFAGHPMVGTAFVLASQVEGTGDALTFEVPAGVVGVQVHREEGRVRGATIEAPAALSVGPEVEPDLIARCVGLEAKDVVLVRHSPIEVSLGNRYVVAEVREAALDQAMPDERVFRDVLAKYPGLHGRFSLYIYTQGEGGVRARMFAPLSGTSEDPATGSAATPLGAFLLSLSSREQESFLIRQGETMKRPSLLHVSAFRTPDGIRARVKGSCVSVFSGTVLC